MLPLKNTHKEFKLLLLYCLCQQCFQMTQLVECTQD